MSSPTGNLLLQELEQPDPVRADAGPSKRKSATRLQKSVASVTGATAVAFISESCSRARPLACLSDIPPPPSPSVTPLDVIKTRLQTQSAPEPLFQPSSHLPSAKGKQPASYNAATCCQKTFFTGNPDEGILTCKYDPRVSANQSGEVNRVAS